MSIPHKQGPRRSPLPPRGTTHENVIAGIPATTKIVNAVVRECATTSNMGTRLIPLSLPRVFWLERPEITP